MASMPDKDLFQTGFAPGWRRAYRIALGIASEDSQVANACVTAAAKSLRESKGCPGFGELAGIVGSVDQPRRIEPLFAGAVDLCEVFESIRRVEEKYGQNRMTKIAARAMRSFLAAERVDVETTDLNQLLAERVCLSLIDHHLFGRGRNYFVKRRFGTNAAERVWENGIKERLKGPISKLAASLLKNSDPRLIRAPSRSGERMSTGELLDKPL